MKDASDTSRYVGEHLSLHCRLLEMGANFSEEESVFQLLTGLPLSSEWRMFKSLLEQQLHDAYSGTVITSTLGAGNSISATFQHNAMTFDSCSTRICGEASRQLNKKALTGPGLEYANVASAGAVVSGETNPITGLQKHPKNPQGIFCMTPVCASNCRGDHDQSHCFSPGGGMEGQAPWQKKRKKDNTPTSSGASTPTVTTSSLPSVPVATAAVTAAFPDVSNGVFLSD
ncbi:hypothetical protein PAXRUDRAFT_138349 [Paxillus rubicundulus Ve08.2h10]|uniref:Uncharacterized protein n=1 Tax=Paxillus rubicundulus Ve08.2h10 TaxID=930991 RepID=A0A0D0DSL5_9AGAM|nr:hypothetical protein PAXRUDRAFT_138349 [Paxillus rubicundulus Ve08.2h10]